MRGLDGTNEDGVGLPDGLGDAVEEPMHAVSEIDIGRDRGGPNMGAVRCVRPTRAWQA